MVFHLPSGVVIACVAVYLVSSSEKEYAVSMAMEHSAHRAIPRYCRFSLFLCAFAGWLFNLGYFRFAKGRSGYLVWTGSSPFSRAEYSPKICSAVRNSVRYTAFTSRKLIFSDLLVLCPISILVAYKPISCSRNQFIKSFGIISHKKHIRVIS